MTIPDGAITNEAGQVALKWALERRTARTIRIDGTNRFYVPVYAHHVALIWVDEQDVDRLMSYRDKVCACKGGTYANAFALANQIDVNLHKCGSRHCE